MKIIKTRSLNSAPHLWKIQSISHQLLDIKDLSQKEKITYFLIVLFAVATVGSVIGILTSAVILGISGFGLHHFIEKKWLQSAIKMEDVSSLVELQNSESYEQGEEVEQLLKPFREQLLNPDLTNAALQQVTETIQQSLS